MGEGNVFTGVCLFTSGGSAFGGKGSAWRGQTSLHADPSRDTVNLRSVRILLECILVVKKLNTMKCKLTFTGLDGLPSFKT